MLKSHMKNECKNILKYATILIVDDHIGIREQLKDNLSLYVSRVYEASDGQEAYELYLKYKPSIIISDINMPVLNGIELSKKIREENKIIPIVLISAYSEKEMLLEAVKLLLIDYLTLSPPKARQRGWLRFWTYHARSPFFGKIPPHPWGSHICHP